MREGGWGSEKMIKILLTSYDSENHWENRWGLGERVNNPSCDAAAKQRSVCDLNGVF